MGEGYVPLIPAGADADMAFGALDHLRLTYNYAGRDFRLTDVAGNVENVDLRTVSVKYSQVGEEHSTYAREGVAQGVMGENMVSKSANELKG